MKRCRTSNCNARTATLVLNNLIDWFARDKFNTEEVGDCLDCIAEFMSSYPETIYPIFEVMNVWWKYMMPDTQRFFKLVHGSIANHFIHKAHIRKPLHYKEVVCSSFIRLFMEFCPGFPGRCMQNSDLV